jgi:hypothetical protein
MEVVDGAGHAGQATAAYLTFDSWYKFGQLLQLYISW